MMESQSRGRVVLCCNDLMMTSSAGHAAKTCGAEFHVVPVSCNLPDAVGSSASCLLLLDLSVADLDLPLLSTKLPKQLLESAVAYGPHVHKDRLAAARAAGFGNVLSRGEFSARCGTLIEQFCRELPDRAD